MMSNRGSSLHQGASTKSRGRIALAVLPVVLLAGLLASTGPVAAGEGEEPPGDSDSGVFGPGESLTTVRGSASNPVNRDDPFAIELTNVSDGVLVGTIEEDECDGSQPEPLCSQPRLGGKAGDFQFTPFVPPSETAEVFGGEGPAEPVVIAKLFYNKNLVRRANGLRILYEKIFGGPVVRLPTCDDDGDGPTTECYSARKLGSGDQIVRIPLQFDPRFTRG